MFDLGFVSLEHSLELTRSEFGRLKSLMEHLVSDVNTIFEIFHKFVFGLRNFVYFSVFLGQSAVSYSYFSQ